MLPELRAARPDDAAAMIAVAGEGGSPDADESYLAFVGEHGRLVVADDGGAVVGFGGAVTVGDTVMVTDLFVTSRARRHRVGGRLLAALVAGHDRRMTCSSTHPGALAAYERAGMEPRRRLLTLAGAAGGGGPALPGGPWRHDRGDLVGWFAARGALVTPDLVVRVAASGAEVCRLVHDEPGPVMEALLASLPADTPVSVSCFEGHELAEWLGGHGFTVADHDVFCATEGVHLAPQLAAVHRGLL